MSDVVLIDTSVLCEILAVPRRHGHLALGEALEVLHEGAREGWTFLLPWATVLETGNHIGQIDDGRLRRTVAQRFVEAVRRSLEGTAPWAPAAPLDEHRFATLLDRFTEWSVSYGSGLGDLSIVDEYERQCRLHPHRRVWVWSLDKHLGTYDRALR